MVCLLTKKILAVQNQYIKKQVVKTKLMRKLCKLKIGYKKLDDKINWKIWIKLSEKNQRNKILIEKIKSKILYIN